MLVAGDSVLARSRRRRRSWNGVTEHPSVSTLLIVPTPSH